MTRKRYVPSTDGTVLGNKRFVLGKDRFVEEGERSKSEIAIGAVKELVETKNHFFVMVDKYAAYIVPKSSFPENRDMESFRKYFESAQVKTKLA